MVRSNPTRRAALLDAAVETLAAEGARGLTFRAVDARAGVPLGTASNYFRDRDDLLAQAGAHVYQHLAAAAASVQVAADAPRDRDLLVHLMIATARRLVDYRTGFLALLELRLEASRRPSVRDVLTDRVRDDLVGNVALHEAWSIPGDEATVLLLYRALSWLVTDALTLPDLVGDDLEAQVERTVRQILPSDGA